MEKMNQPGQLCRNCQSPLIKAVPKKKDAKKAYWFDWYLKCGGCGNMYMVEDAKIINPAYKPKPEPAWKKDWIKNKENKQELDDGYLKHFTALDKIARSEKWITADNLRDIAKKAIDV
jgi:DNA-directed RNA polymerase subunit M/transcription elongation factor TFIIS